MTGPEPAVGGSYALRTLDAKPLPALQLDYAFTRFYLAADTITFYDNGQYAEVSVTRVDSVGSSYSTLQASRGTGDYTVRGDSIDFAFHCPMGALCIAPPIGWRSPDDTITLAYRMTTGLASVRRFEPVP